MESSGDSIIVCSQQNQYQHNRSYWLTYLPFVSSMFVCSKYQAAAARSDSSKIENAPIKKLFSPPALIAIDTYKYTLKYEI